MQQSTLRTVIAALALSACRSAPTPGPAAPQHSAATPPPTAPRPAWLAPHEAPRLLRCEATDVVTAGHLSPGVAAHPALARNQRRGLMVFRLLNPQGAVTLGVQPLNEQGQSLDAEGHVASTLVLNELGLNPSHPTLIAEGDHYLLVYRRGADRQQSIAALRLHADGTPSGAVTAVFSAAGQYGAPGLALAPDGSPLVAAAFEPSRTAPIGSDRPFASQLLRGTLGAPPSALDAPPNGRFDDDAPVILFEDNQPVLYASAGPEEIEQGVERALVRVTREGASLVARDLDFASPHGAQSPPLWAWRSRLTRTDSGIRAGRFDALGESARPPVTTVAFRHAFEAAPRWVTVAGHPAALNLTGLSDDPVVTLNLSLFDPEGRHLGRSPVLTSFATRSTHFAAASAPDVEGADAAAWLVFDGLDGTTPEVLLSRVQCDTSQSVNRLEIAPAAEAQDITPADPAPASLEREAPALRCTAGPSGVFAAHDLGDDATREHPTESAVVSTPAGARLFAIVEQSNRRQLVSALLSPQGRLGPAQPIVANAESLYAAERAHQGALAVTAYRFQNHRRLDVVFARGGAVSHQLIPSGFRDVRSVVAVADRGTLFATGDDESGRAVLVRIDTAPGRVGPPLALMRVGVNDHVIDALREGSATRLLIERADRHGLNVGRAIATVLIQDNARTFQETDPFADVLGYPRGASLLSPLAEGVGVLHQEEHTLKLSRVDVRRLREAQSLFDLFADGGELLASTREGNTQLVALRTGASGENAQHRAITLARLERGVLRGVTAQAPNDGSAAAEGTTLALSGDTVTQLFQRPVDDPQRPHTVAWHYLQSTCTAGVQR